MVARRRRGTSVVGPGAASPPVVVAVASAAPVVAAAAIVSSSSSSSSSSSAVAAGRAGRTASPAPASASASAIFAVVDAARASHDVRAVHGLHGLRRRVGVGEGDEAEAPGPPGLPVGDDLVVREGRRGREGGEGAIDRIRVRTKCAVKRRILVVGSGRTLQSVMLPRWPSASPRARSSAWKGRLPTMMRLPDMVEGLFTCVRPVCPPLSTIGFDPGCQT